MTQAQIMVKLSLSYQSLLEAITSLELREMIQLKLLLDRKIQEGLAKYEGTDDLTIKVEQSEPWVKFAGMFKDDPLFDEFVEDMDTYRRELSPKVPAHEVTSGES